MKRTALFLILLSAGVGAQVRPGSFTLRTLIGSGFRGDGGPALEALLDGPAGLAEDAEGNLYIAESNAGLIRRMKPDGTIERFAGTGTIDDGPAGQAALDTHLVSPSLLLMDREGRLVFADNGTCRIRRVEKDGSIADLAGSGRCSGTTLELGGGFPGGGGLPGSSAGLRTGLALETDLGYLGGLAEDGQGLLVFSDVTNNGIRRLDADGYVRAIAGTGRPGYSGDSIAATAAMLYSPTGLVYDPAGRLYISDSNNCRIRRVNTDGTIETVAGNGVCSSSSTFASGIPTTRALGSITALAYERDTESIYVASPSQARVLRFEPTRTRISSFLGSGQRGVLETERPNEWRLDTPAGILASAQWGIVVSEATAFRVSRVQDTVVSTLAGAWPQRDEYAEAAATALLRPKGLCLLPDGKMLVVDGGAERLLTVSAAGEVKALAGMKYPTGFTAGDGGSALEARVGGVDRVLCAPNGEIYLAQDSRLRAIDAEGVIRTVLNGLELPAGLALDKDGRLYYSEADAHRVSRYDFTTKEATVIAGTGTAGFGGDGGSAAAALLSTPGDLAVDSQGNLLIADRGNRRIRRVTPDGQISTIAGSYRGFIYSDITGELATDIGFGTINGLTLDAADNIFVSEYPRISVIGTDGRVRIITGYAGEDDNGVKSYLDEPRRGCDSLAVDLEGRIYFSARMEGKVIVAEPVKPE